MGLCNCSHTIVVFSGQGLLNVAGLANLPASQCICGLHNSSPSRPPIIDVCVVEVDYTTLSLSKVNSYRINKKEKEWF